MAFLKTITVCVAVCVSWGCQPQLDVTAKLVNSAGGGDTQTISNYLNRGANINGQSKQHFGWTPLFAAIDNRQQASVDFLLDAGADVNQPDSGLRETPLIHCIVSWPENTNLISRLLSLGADPAKKSAIGIDAYAAAGNDAVIMGMLSKRLSADLCVSNFTEIFWIIRKWVGEGIEYPPSLDSLAEDTDRADLFVYPDSGHRVGSMTNVEDWTDFIFVGSERDIQDPNVALLISPPENQKGHFGIVLWHGGNSSLVTAQETRRLIDAPWYMATNAPLEQIEYLKRFVTVKVPKRFRGSYPNAYHASGPTNLGSNGPANGEK
jgi:Ankyrin repeats (3 copies)